MKGRYAVKKIALVATAALAILVSSATAAQPQHSLSALDTGDFISISGCGYEPTANDNTTAIGVETSNYLAGFWVFIEADGCFATAYPDEPDVMVISAWLKVGGSNFHLKQVAEVVVP